MLPNHISDPPIRAFTIGHSNHSITRFLDLLRQTRIDVIADTRSVPKSRFACQFDMEPLKLALKDVGISYVFLGRELGGCPRGPEFYDDAGHVLYDKVARSELFLDGISRLQIGLK